MCGTVDVDLRRRDLISRTTRGLFRDLMIGSTLGEIGAAFQDELFAPNPDSTAAALGEPAAAGDRRCIRSPICRDRQRPVPSGSIRADGLEVQHQPDWGWSVPIDHHCHRERNPRTDVVEHLPGNRLQIISRGDQPLHIVSVCGNGEGRQEGTRCHLHRNGHVPLRTDERIRVLHTELRSTSTPASCTQR